MAASGAVLAALLAVLGSGSVWLIVMLGLVAATVFFVWRYAAAQPSTRAWLQALADAGGDLALMVDKHGMILDAVVPADSGVGYTREQMLNHSVGKIFPRSLDSRLRAALNDASRGGQAPHLLRSQMRLAAGRWREVEIAMTKVRGAGVLVRIHDVSERTQLEADLMRQAYSDPLTGLANRSLFQSRVQQAVKNATGPGEVAVLFVDLDGFKSVNDTLGHAIGDELLVTISRRLQECIREGDLVARLGGDEFAVLVTGEESERSAVGVAERIRTVVPRTVVLAGREIAPGGSTGIAVSDTGAETAEQLLRNADLAMYRAKAEGNSGYVRYENHMHESAVAHMQAETDLRQAIASGDLVLHYQPVVNLATGAVVGVEALIRWVHATKGLLSPASFIDLAEKTGLVRDIGAWALSTACRDAMRWQRFAPPGRTFHVSVNVSPRQLGPELLETVRAALRESRLPTGVLMLEMTESIFMDSPDEASELLRRLRAEGVKIALDDFGTGYSSLSYLTRLPVDVLKVDRAFVRYLGGGQRTGPGELTRTILQLCRSLQLGAIAEGVETPVQRQALLDLGCQFAQGFLFAAAMRAEAIDALLSGGAGLGPPEPQEVVAHVPLGRHRRAQASR